MQEKKSKNKGLPIIEKCLCSIIRNQHKRHEAVWFVSNKNSKEVNSYKNGSFYKYGVYKKCNFLSVSRK